MTTPSDVHKETLVENVVKHPVYTNEMTTRSIKSALKHAVLLARKIGRTLSVLDRDQLLAETPPNPNHGIFHQMVYNMKAIEIRSFHPHPLRSSHEKGFVDQKQIPRREAEGRERGCHTLLSTIIARLWL